MSGITVKMEGDLKLVAKLNKCCNLDAVKTVVHHSGDELNRNMKDVTQSAFVKGYSHGDTARSINTNITDGGMTAEVGPTTYYAGYVEFGTRKMSAEPFVRPALKQTAPKFISDLKKVVN